MNTIIRTIKEKGGIVADAFRYVIGNNDSAHAPYHNTDHMLWIAQKCYEGALYHSLSPRQTDMLIVAALFHDFNHSGGEYPDATNVKVAIDGFKDFFMNSFYVFDEPFMEAVIQVIQATEYPYVIKPEDLFVEQAIIRDADLMQGISDNWFGMIMMGLSKEAKGVELGKMVEGNIKFHEGIEMCSEWGERIYITHCDELFGNMHALKELISE